MDELEKEGYIDGDNIVIDYENAQGDQSNLQTISTNLIANNDLVLGIATPAHRPWLIYQPTLQSCLQQLPTQYQQN